MCDTAVWKDTKINYRGSLVTLKRGQLITTVKYISEQFCIGEQVTRTLLENLLSEGMTNNQTTNRGTIITIANYDKYQLPPVPDQQATNNQLTNDQQTGNKHKKKYNKLNKDNKIKDSMGGQDLNLFPEEQEQPPPEKSAEEIAFEQFWAIFPKRRASPRAKALEAWHRAVTRAPAGEIIKAAMAYAKSDEVRRGYAKATTAWLNDDRWTWDYAGGTAQQKQTYNLSNPKKKNTVTL